MLALPELGEATPETSAATGVCMRTGTRAVRLLGAKTILMLGEPAEPFVGVIGYLLALCLFFRIRFFVLLFLGHESTYTP